MPGALPSVAPGETIPLSKLPPLRAAHGRIVRTMAATGATIKITTQTGCGSTVGTIYNVGCQVQWQTQSLPSCSSGSCHQDYYIDADAATATAAGSAYSGTSGATNSQTLSNSGTYVFAVLNSNTSNWDAIVYVTVGTATVFETYSDSSDHNLATTFTASTSTTVYINASGLTPTDSYVVYVESTSVTGHCVFMAPSGSLGTSLCNPTNSAGENAIGGGLNVPWQLSSSLTPGTYSIVIYDLTTNNRLAQRQIGIVSSSPVSSWSITPTGGNASPAPAPAGTPGVIFAFDGTLDESDKQLTFKATGLTSTDHYDEVVSDPNGYVVNHNNSTPNGSGVLSVSWSFAQTQSPEDYVGRTYTLSLYDSTTSTMITSQGFEILGYYMATEFMNPAGTALSINSPSTSATSDVQFMNSSDLLWGSGNGDTFRGMELDTGSQGITATLGSSATSCGSKCTTQNVTDSNGQTWVVTDTQSGNGANADSTIVLTPFTSGQTLAIGATVTVPSITFNNPPGSHCSSGCTLNSSVLPTDGQTWSSSTQGLAANQLYITNGFGTSYSATGHIALYGETVSGTLIASDDAHGYARNFTHALFDNGQPFSVSGGAQDVLALTINNTSSAGSTAIQAMQITFPSAFSVSSATINSSSPSTWTTAACPSGTPSNVLCIQKGGSNQGIAANGGSETIYININAPTLSFAYTDVTVAVTTPSNFSVTSDGTATVFSGSTSTIDSMALGGFSLDYTKITPLVAPATVGSNTTPSLIFTVTNTTSVADTNPDFVDAVIIEVPTSSALSGISTSTPGWSYLGSSVNGSNTRYWFGLCALQFSTANGPAANPPPVTSASLPSCGQSTEYASSLAAGAALTVDATTSVSTSNVPMIEYAHGANGDGWSKPTNFTLNVNTLAVTAGFSKVGQYGSPPAVSSNTTPETAADSNTTYGNSYVYEIKNISSSGSGQNVSSATITVPGSDISSSNGADSSGVAWTITATPTLTMSGGASGCSVTSYTSASSTPTNGSIVIGGSGCNIPPGGTVDVNFSAKAPYKINDTYKFSTVYTGGSPACSPTCSAAEAWFSDTDIEVILSANLTVTVHPVGTGPGGSTPTTSCAPCTYSSGLIDFGSISNGSSVTGTDIVTVSVYTDAANNDPWKLYVSTSNNPANTGSPTNELLSDVDQTASNLSGAGVNFDQTSMTVVPTSGSGSTLVDTGSGANPRRLPYDIVMNFQVSIQGGPITSEVSTITYTFIAQ